MDVNHPILPHIESRLEEMRRSERKVAELVLARPDARRDQGVSKVRGDVDQAGLAPGDEVAPGRVMVRVGRTVAAAR